MPLPVDDKDVIRAALRRAAGADAGAAQVAEAASVIWLAIVSDLEPLIGPGGVHALLSRCLHVQGVAAPEPAASAAGHPPFAAMRSHLQGLAPAAALDAAADFFDRFGTLLGSLIGATLTARHLNPVWAEHDTDPPARAAPERRAPDLSIDSGVAMRMTAGREAAAATRASRPTARPS